MQLPEELSAEKGPPQKEEKRHTRDDKLARTPAVAVAWHLPERMTKDFFALSVLDPLLISDESAKLYQKLVREDRLAMQVVGAFNFLGDGLQDRLNPVIGRLRAGHHHRKRAVHRALDAAAHRRIEHVESVFDDHRRKLRADLSGEQDRVARLNRKAGVALPG